MKVKLTYAVFCEYAREGVLGKADIFGVFHGLDAPQFPAQVQSMFLCAHLHDVPVEDGFPKHYPVAFEIVAPDEQMFLKIEGTMLFGAQPDRLRSTIQMVLNLSQPAFIEPGMYKSSLTVNSERFEGPDLLLTQSVLP